MRRARRRHTFSLGVVLLRARWVGGGLVIDRDPGLRARRPDAATLILAGREEDEAPVVRVRREPGYVLITVTGEVDYASVPGLRERLFALADDGRPLVADLDRVSFIDAAGLGVLAAAARRAVAHGASLHVVCARDRIRRLFGLTGLDRAVPLAARLAEALQDTAGSKAAAVRGGVQGQRRRASGSANHSPANKSVTNAVISPAVRPLET
jgi:anti-sigma B factor antagonist